jgi:hypothetical protein
LQRDSGRTVTSKTTPVDTTSYKSEIKSESSDSLIPIDENKDNKGKLATYLSAASGSSSGGSSKSKNSWRQSLYPSSDESLSQVDSTKVLTKIAPSSSTLPRTQITNTVAPLTSTLSRAKVTNIAAKMATHPAANFDADLEHIITMILKLTLTHPLALALSQSFVNTFDDFRTIDVNDVHEFRYNMTSVPITTPAIKLHVTIVKKIQRMVSYACYKEDKNHADCDTPTSWDIDVYSKWCRNGYATNLTSLIPVPSSTTVATSTPATATTAAFVTTAQKDDDAALISWNRKPRDVAKYPLLKNDADYQDWKLKMKRQLIADTLSQVTDPTFRITTCRTGADMELATLQINFFEQILSAVLLNPEGKGLITTHPEDALFVWNEHKAHQLDSDSAQISTTA